MIFLLNKTVIFYLKFYIIKLYMIDIIIPEYDKEICKIYDMKHIEKKISHKFRPILKIKERSCNGLYNYLKNKDDYVNK